MNESTLKAKILEEVNLIPDDKLVEFYNYIHSLRMELGESENKKEKIMKFAGCWQDMPDEVFAEFSEAITTRRQQAFSRRRNSEIGID